MRKEKYPELFLNRNCTILEVSFLKLIDELFVEFLIDKDEFQFPYGFENNKNYLCAPVFMKNIWVTIIINLERRIIVVLDTAVSGMKEEVKKSHVKAYATVIPYIVRKVYNNDDMDISPFKISIEKNVPQVKTVGNLNSYIGVDIFLITKSSILFCYSRLIRLKIHVSSC